MNVRILEDDVVWRELDGETVILNLATGTYYGLEGSANAIWRLLLEHRSTERVIDQMVVEYDVNRARVTRDVDALVRDLSRRNIVRIDSGTRK